MTKLTVRSGETGQRFDKFLKKYLSEAPASFLYKMLRKKNITLNGKKADGREMLSEGDVITLFLSDETIAKFHRGSSDSADGSRPVSSLREPETVYEDEDVIFYNKPAGMPVQSGSSSEPSIASELTRWLLAGNRLTEEDLRAQRPSPANRIDRNTSGLVLCGKTLHGLQALSEEIRGHALQKEYLVLTGGNPVEDGIYRIWAEKDRSENRMKLFDVPEAHRVEMITDIRLISRGKHLSLLRVGLITGRTHQIRSHLACLGMPVAGDPKYGSPSLNRQLKAEYGISRQMLHARSAAFPESCSLPSVRGRRFSAPLPEDFTRVMAGEGMRKELISL